MKSTYFFGIDISKDKLDVCVYDGCQRQIMDLFLVDNTTTGITKLCKRILRLKSVDSWICFEHTGNYGLLLSSILEEHEICYSAVSAMEIKRSIGLVRGKNDRVDAIRISQYAASNAHKLQTSKLPCNTLLKLKSCLTYRNQLIRIRTQLKNSLQSHQLMNKTVDVGFLLNNIANQIKGLDELIKEIGDKIQALIHSDSLIRNNYDKITSIKGIGPLIAANMLLYTNNFTSFENARQFNCFAGTAPFENSSGSSLRGRTKVSKYRNKSMKALLYNGAYRAIRLDSELNAYYKRKINEGKHKQCVINAIACKLVYRAFAVIKREEPYVQLMRC